MKCDICGARMVARQATAKAPYHYVLSGLPNVYLVGIEVRRCPNGHGESPALYRMTDLHRTIAAALILKPSTLTGDEVRFLRKFAGIAANEFADQLRITKHTMSRIEHGTQKMGATADKLARVIAAAWRQMDSAAKKVLLSAEQLVARAPQRLVLKATQRGWKEAA